MIRSAAFYVFFLAVSIGVIILILHAGSSAHLDRVPEPQSIGVGAGPLTLLLEAMHNPVSELLLQILVIVTAACLMGALFAKIGQPPVVGEMFAGIALGPSLLGHFLPAVSHFVFPQARLGNLSMLSQIGVLLFMFLVGMELDIDLLRRRAGPAILISHASIVTPFCLGSVSAVFLFQRYAGSATSFHAFALFMGTSMSITAFPVLARILQQRNLLSTDLGNTALTCAAVDDASAWCILAVVTAVCKHKDVSGAVVTLGLTLLFALVVLGGVRPLLKRLLIPKDLGSFGEDKDYGERQGDVHPGRGALVVALAVALGCGLVTEAIGIHSLFGAFLAGIAMPRPTSFRRFLARRIETFCTIFLLPIFFVLTGLRTELRLLVGLPQLGTCALLILVAVTGKFGGSALAARLTGFSWRDATGIGALMNTRGLVELVALNLGLDLGVLSPALFTMLVVMALLTTFCTGPVLSALGLGSFKSAPIREAALSTNLNSQRAEPEGV